MSMGYGECDSCCSLFDDDQLVRFIDDTGNNEFEDRCKSCGPPNWFKSIATKDAEIARLKAENARLIKVSQESMDVNDVLRKQREQILTDHSRRVQGITDSLSERGNQLERLREKARAVVEARANIPNIGSVKGELIFHRAIDALRSEVEG